MAFDTTKINGFDTMTAEEKVTALLGELEGSSSEIDHLKAAISKTASENAEKKRAARDAETVIAGKDAEIKALNERVAAMEKREAVANSKAKFISLGYSEALAEETANAMADGDMDKVFANMGTAKAENDNNLRSSLIRSTKGIEGAGNGSQTMTRDEIFKIRDTIARQNAIAENMEMFQKNTN